MFKGRGILPGRDDLGLSGWSIGGCLLLAQALLYQLMHKVGQIVASFLKLGHYSRQFVGEQVVVSNQIDQKSQRDPRFGAEQEGERKP